MHLVFLIPLCTADEAADFCENIEIDDVIKYDGMFRIFSNNHYWDVRGTHLPLDTPHPQNAKPITGMDSPIDAATDLGEENAFVYFRGANVVFMKNDQTVDRKIELHKFLSLKSQRIERDITITAAWFSPHNRHLFLFAGKRYFEMERKNGTRWTIVHPEDRLIVADFKITYPSIDAAFTIGDKLILFHRNWYFTVPDKDFIYPAAAYAANLAFGSREQQLGLFDTKEGCPMSEETFNHLRANYDSDPGVQSKDEDGKDATNPLKKPAADEADDDQKDDRQIWPYVVLAIIVFLLLLVAIYLICCRTKRQAEPAIS